MADDDDAIKYFKTKHDEDEDDVCWTLNLVEK